MIAKKPIYKNKVKIAFDKDLKRLLNLVKNNGNEVIKMLKLGKNERKTMQDMINNRQKP